MDYRILSGSGLKVPALSFGTATFGGTNEIFKAWGSTDVAEATRMVDICLDAGINFFDSANNYSEGVSEEILGKAIEGRRNDLLISTKGSSRVGSQGSVNDVGSSRYNIVRACEASLRRLGTDHIDLYYMHANDALTPIEETLRALEDLVRAGKVLYAGCSNYSGWHLMKALGASEKYGLPRMVAHQVSYSLLVREYEWELMPLALDQHVGGVVWSPLAGGKLGGRIRRGEPMPEVSRSTSSRFGIQPGAQLEKVYAIVEVLDHLAAETGKSVTQVALNWVLQRPSVSTVVFGARNEDQLRENLGAVGWSLTPEQIAVLDDVSKVPPIYPYSHQQGPNRERNPRIV